jgi:hypothetical protein
MKRNRIVINVDPNERRARRRGRLGRLLLIAGVVLVLIVAAAGVGGYFWWRSFQNGPAYSLALLVDAVQRNDAPAVDKMLDPDKISSDFVAQVREKTPGSSLASSLSATQADAITTTVSARLKQTVHDQLIDELRTLTEQAKGKPLFLIALGIPYFADINQANNLAYATVNIKGEQIKLTMQAVDDRWRITAVQDDKLAKMVADAVVKNLPATAPRFQEEIRKQLDKLKK